MLNSCWKSHLAAAIGVLSALVAVAPAHAVPVNVTYNMNYQFFSALAGANVLQGPGVLTVQFTNGTALGHVGAGNLHVVSGTAMLTNNFTLFGGAIVFTGGQSDLFAGSGMGAITSLGMWNLTTIGHIVSGMLHCSGACSAAGFVPSVQNNLTSGPRPLNINNPANIINGFPSVGPQNFVALGTGGMSPGGGNFGLTATGNEIGRVVVPEPGTGLLVGCGMAMFGMGMTTWRRVRRGRA
jgi:hypothetical protein